jgi:hypothetical protein
MREMSEAPLDQNRYVCRGQAQRTGVTLGRRILFLGSRAMRTGFPQADARDDFERARRQARWVKLAGWLRGRPSSRNRPLVLGEVTVVTGAGSRGLVSEAAVPIGHIVGSVEPTLCFDRHFRPTSQLPRTRFERIAADVRCGRGMDPVDLYHCGGRYYVLDGHHRIAVARALGERSIWATITEVRMNQPGTPRSTQAPSTHQAAT